jgi:hypothetical protein
MMLKYRCEWQPNIRDLIQINSHQIKDSTTINSKTITPIIRIKTVTRKEIMMIDLYRLHLARGQIMKGSRLVHPLIDPRQETKIMIKITLMITTILVGEYKTPLLDKMSVFVVKNLATGQGNVQISLMYPWRMKIGSSQGEQCRTNIIIITMRAKVMTLEPVRIIDKNQTLLVTSVATVAIMLAIAQTARR